MNTAPVEFRFELLTVQTLNFSWSGSACTISLSVLYVSVSAQQLCSHVKTITVPNSSVAPANTTKQRLTQSQYQTPASHLKTNQIHYFFNFFFLLFFFIFLPQYSFSNNTLYDFVLNHFLNFNMLSTIPYTFALFWKIYMTYLIEIRYPYCNYRKNVQEKI